MKTLTVYYDAKTMKSITNVITPVQVVYNVGNHVFIDDEKWKVEHIVIDSMQGQDRLVQQVFVSKL